MFVVVFRQLFFGENKGVFLCRFWFGCMCVFCRLFVLRFLSQFCGVSILTPVVCFRFVGCVQTVVVTYAAMAIERILAVKDRPPGQRPTLRLQKDRLVPFLEGLFRGLFAVRLAEHLVSRFFLSALRFIGNRPVDPGISLG